MATESGAGLAGEWLPGAEGRELGDLGFGELAPGHRRELQALTPGSAISEGAIRGRLRMFVLGSRVSKDSAAYRTHTHGHQRPVRVYRARRDVTRHPVSK